MEHLEKKSDAKYMYIQIFKSISEFSLIEATAHDFWLQNTLHPIIHLLSYLWNIKAFEDIEIFNMKLFEPLLCQIVKIRKVLDAKRVSG